MNIGKQMHARVGTNGAKRKSLSAILVVGLITSLSLITPTPVQAAEYSERGFRFMILSNTDRTLRINGCVNTCPKNLTLPEKIDGAFNLFGLLGTYTVTEIGESAFQSTDVETVTLPTSLLRIGFNAFKDTNLRSVSIPANVSDIDDEAFAYTNGPGPLKSVIFKGDGLKSIGAGAFSNQSLTTVNLPTFVRAIGAEAFARNQLTLLSIPSSVESIDDYAFFDNRLTEVKLWLYTPPKLGLQVFGGNDRLQSILRPYYPNNPSVFPNAIGGIPLKIMKTKAWGGEPKITGRPKIGQTITVDKGTWYGYPAPLIKLQWYACTEYFENGKTLPSTCKKISGATKSQLKVTAPLLKRYLAVSVTATSEGTASTSYSICTQTWVSK